MYLPENVLLFLYGDHEEGTDKSTFMEARFRDARFRDARFRDVRFRDARFRDARFKLLQTITLSRQKAHIYFFLPLARFMCFRGQIQ